MHELPIINQVLETVLEYGEKDHATRVEKIVLDVGGLHDLIPEWMEKYFHFAARGTIAENARLLINKTPIICRFDSCGCNFVYHLHDDSLSVHGCPECGSNVFSPISGREFIIREIEVS
jgi:hydrogenase nickel incorporation protein HypA/HybF